MIKYIKEKFLKKEIALIDGLIGDFNKLKKSEQEEINLIKEELKEKEHKLSLRVDKWNMKIKGETRNRFKKQLLDTKKTLDELTDFNLLPGNKVWGIEGYSNDIRELEIESILITKDDIQINSNGFYQEHLFKTEKEAISMYNQILEDRKLTTK